MSIRLRVIFAIVLVNLAIILFGVLGGSFSVQSGIEKSQEADLTTIANIADRFISGEIELLELKASGVARDLTVDARMPEILEKRAPLYPEFTGMAVFDAETGRIAATGESPAPQALMDDPYIKRAFQGRAIFSSTIRSANGIVFYLAVPVAGARQRILAVTLPGMYFRELLSTFIIWETGHIFIDDAEGVIIANAREEWVRNRVNFIRMAETDAQYEGTAAVVKRALRGESGTGHFSIFGVPRLCAFRPISGSEAGWILGVVAPLPESPFRHINRGLMMVGLVSLALSIVAAAAASGFIQKPFAEVAALKDAAEANSRSKSDFLANMSHEIRTPMNAIVGVTEILMRDEALRANTREGLRRIYSSADLLLHIINDILDLSKIEEGKLELAPAPYETASLFNETAALNVARVGSKEIEFELSVEEDMPSNLFGDALRIKQILNNLLSNAFKYTESGRVRLSCAAERESGDESAATLVLCVSDTGRGMTEEQLATLFDKYVRFDVGSNRVIEGVGLGMNITRRLVELMDGAIFVESEPGRGSSFTVRLPQRRVGVGVLGPEAAENLRTFHAGGGEPLKRAQIVFEPMPYGRILLVDDVESNLFVAKGLLAPYKLSLEAVQSGFEAVGKIRDGGVYDIIFMDHMMPKMDGIEAAKIIRGMGYTGPIVALTANAVAGQAEAFLAIGFDDFVSKPIDVRQIDAVLKKYVRDKQSPEALAAARAMKKHARGEAVRASLSMTPKLAASFARDARRAVAALEAICEKQPAYGDEDFNLYTITVHGMKGALANIGELDLADAAADLERAGEEKDAAAISAETPAFLEALRALAGKLAQPD